MTDIGTTLFTTPRSWTLVACLAFFFATAYAVAVVFFRLPLPGLREPYLFRVSLALHVELAVYFWLMATMAAVWSAARGGVASGARRAIPLMPLVAGAGTLLTASSSLLGGVPLMMDYFPWLDGNGLFLAGFSIFSIAVFASAARAAIRLWSRREASEWRGTGLSALPVLAALLTVLSELANGARTPVVIAWGAGHTLLFAHVAAMCLEWGRLCRQGQGSNGPHLAAAAVLATVSLAMPLIPFVYDPGSAEHMQAFTFTMRWLLWPPALVAGIVTLRQLWMVRGCDESGPVPARLVIGLACTFGLIGIVLGALITGPTTLVTAHYHAAIGAVVLTRMAMTYQAADILAFGWPSVKAARRQLLTYATALFLLVSGLALGAVDAAPRKTSAGELVAKGPYFKAGMSISGAGGLFAIGGSLWLLVNLLYPAGTAHNRVGRNRQA